MLERSAEATVVDGNPLEHVLTIAPPCEPIRSPFAFHDLLGRQMCFGIEHVEVIENHTAATLESAGDVVDHREVICVVFEVSKARKEIQDIIESAVTERQPHILTHEPKARMLAQSRLPEALARQIQAGDVESFGRQIF
jgi:hypothetical protein